MLVLSRKKNESIVINSDITVTVLEINPDGRSVRLGFVAPETVSILRKEKREEMKRGGKDDQPPTN